MNFDNPLSKDLGRNKLGSLLDEGTFVEIGTYIGRDSASLGCEYEGVICGYGAIGGKLVFVFAEDSDRMKGAFDKNSAKKIKALYTSALKNGAPVIGIFDSCGAVVSDGAYALSAYAEFMACVSEASGKIPQIAIVDGVCAGSMAVICSMFDFQFACADSAKIYVNSPFVAGNECDAANAAKNGAVAVKYDNLSKASAAVRELVSLIPSNCSDGAEESESNDDINREISNGNLLYEIVDDKKFFELYSDFAPGMKIGFASLGGICVGIVANDKLADDGAISLDGARKASKFITFCDSFDIPVVTLVDSIGADTGAGEEDALYSSELARLAFAYSSSKNAKVTVICGNAIGNSFILMGSKALGADMVYALEDAVVSVLTPEASVAFLWNDKVGKEGSREELEAKWRDEKASALLAAASGEVDDIIPHGDIRKRIISAIYMSLQKNDCELHARHINMPL